MEKSDGRRKQGNIHSNSLALADTEKPSDWSKKTNPKKEEVEQDITTDIPAKRIKTDGSKKVGRQAIEGPGDDGLEAVGAPKSPKSSKPLKVKDKKRKHVGEQELAAEFSTCQVHQKN